MQSFKSGILACFCLVAVAWARAQQLPNADFENWTSFWGGEFESPVGWASANDLFGTFGFVTVTKSTQSQSGMFAARLETIALPDDNRIAGFIAIANINYVAELIHPGMAFTSRPDSLIGHFRYSPANGDSAAVLALLTRSTFFGKDTVGVAFALLKEPLDNYTKLALPFFYFNAASPDSLTLIISASANFDFPETGSILWVDNLSFSGIALHTGPVIPKEKPHIYPNPSNGYLHVDAKEADMLEVLDASGRLVYRVEIAPGVQSIQLPAHLHPGLYIARTMAGVQRILLQ